MNETVLPGQRLQAERVRQGLSEEEVSGTLKLSRSYLRALEADDYERLPEATFIKGYMRNYARLLGLPSEEVAEAFERLLRDQQPEQDDTDEASAVSPASSGVPVWLWPAAVVLVLIIFLVWSGGAEDDSVSAVDTGAAPAEQENIALPEDELAEAAAQPAVEQVELIEQGEPVPAEVSAPAATDTQADSLVARFADECWVEVHEVGSGALLYQGQQSADSRLEVTGAGPFRLTLGNASALSSLRFNDQTLTPPSGPEGQVVRVNVP